MRFIRSSSFHGVLPWTSKTISRAAALTVMRFRTAETRSSRLPSSIRPGGTSVLPSQAGTATSFGCGVFSIGSKGEWE